MSHRALYRQYRPATFSEMIGQEHITTILKNQVKSGTTAHAYLFAGTRGTGKTSAARILARAVNCEAPVDGEPCGRCRSCKISAGECADIIELDAASNTGVDDMRDIIEKARFMPLELKHKVYIIDEAHALSANAFNALLKTLEDVSRKIDEEREQKAYLRRFQQEGREYEQYARRKFFEQVTSGSLRVSEIYEQAKKLQIDIDAEGYTVILLTLQSRGAAEYSQTLADRLEELMAYLLRYGEYLLFRCNLMTYCIIVKGSGAGLNDAVHRCLENIQRRCGGDEALAWYAAVSDPVARLSELPGCYARAHTILSYRHLLPEQHVLTADVLKKPQRGGLSELDEVDASKADPAIIRSFLQTGMREEIPDFVSEYLSSFGNALNSMLFRQYVLLELRFSAIRAAKSFGYSQEEFLRPLEPAQARAVDADLPELKKSCAAFLRRAIELREEESGNQYKSMLKRALHYIDQNYTDENLSLNAVAKAANISPNYFSGVFSQEMGQTFVEYLTEKRMARAKELLRYSGKRSSEVAYEVGYRDPRYFSFLFKKTQGCTPSSYRAGNGDGHEAK